MTEHQQIFYHLGVALAIGLLIGTERGWQEREAHEGQRVAGVRTYGLLGLLGGVLALVAEKIGSVVLGLAFLALALIWASVYAVNLHLNAEKDIGITSLVAGLLTFIFGALAVLGEVAIATACGVVTTLLLGYKPLLHKWVSTLRGRELRAGIKLLLISVVLLPILPDRGFGPWQALNPYEMWWMVVLIAAISFIGYFAIKIGGTRKGTVFTGLFGGLASSTALTLHFSRLSQHNRTMIPALATGALLACGTMFPRMLFVATILNRNLLQPLLIPTIVMSLFIYVPAIFYWRTGPHEHTETGSVLKNPLELITAINFGIFLAAVMLFSRILRQKLGEAGVLMLAMVSGIADVDAITLSLARMSRDDLALGVTVLGIILAAAVNNLVKGGMAMVVGGSGLGLRVALPLALSSIAGLLTAWLLFH